MWQCRIIVRICHVAAYVNQVSGLTSVDSFQKKWMTKGKFWSILMDGHLSMTTGLRLILMTCIHWATWIRLYHLGKTLHCRNQKVGENVWSCVNFEFQRKSNQMAPYWSILMDGDLTMIIGRQLTAQTCIPWATWINGLRSVKTPNYKRHMVSQISWSPFFCESPVPPIETNLLIWELCAPVHTNALRMVTSIFSFLLRLWCFLFPWEGH